VRVAHEQFTQGAWRKMKFARPRRLLMRIADLLRENLMHFRQLESRNGGKPISATSWELESVANTFEYYAGAVNNFTGRRFRSPRTETYSPSRTLGCAS